MDIIKKTNPITSVINDYLKSFNATAQIGTDFCCFLNKNLIQYSLVVTEKSNEYFKDFCASLNPNVKADIFLLSLFHEIFHLETRNKISDEDFNYSQDMKTTLTTSKEDCYIYFNLPDEKLATQSALNYMESHAEEISCFWNKLQKEILKFYKENEITD